MKLKLLGACSALSLLMFADADAMGFGRVADKAGAAGLGHSASAVMQYGKVSSLRKAELPNKKDRKNVPMRTYIAELKKTAKEKGKSMDAVIAERRSAVETFREKADDGDAMLADKLISESRRFCVSPEETPSSGLTSVGKPLTGATEVEPEVECLRSDPFNDEHSKIKRIEKEVPSDGFGTSIVDDAEEIDRAEGGSEVNSEDIDTESLSASATGRHSKKSSKKKKLSFKNAVEIAPPLPPSVVKKSDGEIVGGGEGTGKGVKIEEDHVSGKSESNHDSLNLHSDKRGIGSHSEDEKEKSVAGSENVGLVDKVPTVVAPKTDPEIKADGSGENGGSIYSVDEEDQEFSKGVVAEGENSKKTDAFGSEIGAGLGDGAEEEEKELLEVLADASNKNGAVVIETEDFVKEQVLNVAEEEVNEEEQQKAEQLERLKVSIEEDKANLKELVNGINDDKQAIKEALSVDTYKLTVFDNAQEDGYSKDNKLHLLFEGILTNGDVNGAGLKSYIKEQTGKEISNKLANQVSGIVQTYKQKQSELKTRIEEVNRSIEEYNGLAREEKLQLLPLEDRLD